MPQTLEAMQFYPYQCHDPSAEAVINEDGGIQSPGKRVKLIEGDRPPLSRPAGTPVRVLMTAGNEVLIQSGLGQSVGFAWCRRDLLKPC